MTRTPVGWAQPHRKQSMRLRFSLIDPALATTMASTPPLEVLVDCDEHTTFGAVRGNLVALVGAAADPERRRPADASLRFDVDGRPVADSSVLGAPPLLEGAALTARRPQDEAARMPLGTAALLELHVAGGPGAGRRLPLRRGEHVVGRGPHCSIRLDDPGVSRVHAVIAVDDDGVRVTDLAPSNASTIDGEVVPAYGRRLEVGARLRLASTTLVLRVPTSTPAPSAVDSGLVRLHRRPRFASAAPFVTIEMPQPPEAPQRSRMPLLASMAPLVISSVLALVLRSPAMLLFALMSPVLLLGQWWGDRRNGRSSHRRRLAEHRSAVAEAHHRLAVAVDEEEHARRGEHPDLSEVAAVVELRDGRIWERSDGDPDDLVVRLGTADLTSRVEVTGAPTSDPQWCRDVPVVIDLKAGVIGVAGPRARVLAMAGGVLVQVCAWHSPRRVRLVILTTSSNAAGDWGWASRVPHSRGRGESIARVAQSCDRGALALRLGELADLVRTRQATAHSTSHPVVNPAVIVVLDGAQALRTEPGVTELLRSGPTVGVHFVCLDESAASLPGETRTQIELGHPPSHGRLTSPGLLVDAFVSDLPTLGWLERMARSLAPLEDATPISEEDTGLPELLGFGELAGAVCLDPFRAEDLLRSWSTSGPPRAVIGMTRDGPLTIDLVRDGPHLLVGGTTGSGKSELLQTLVTGLAVASRPDDLSFVLVDYKGGSAFTDCADLPHVTGMVTDLDEELTSRALTSLGAELRRRERVLASAGCKDLDDLHRRRRSDAALPALGRLVIVVDEFKVLADELPDFVSGLVRLAAVGRSLGVHLVLATQRPGGIVSADMRANISLRIALRVRDRSDSEDVLEGPQAASIAERTPGRAFVRTADQRLVEVQVAHVGTTVPDRPARSVAGSQPNRPERSPSVWPLTWRELARPAPRPLRDGGGSRTELSVVVQAARAAADVLGVRPAPPPWLPPLPHHLSFAALSGEHRGVPIGLCDVPAEQRQSVTTWDPDTDGHLGIAGGPRTGRSSTVRAIVLGLCERYSPTDLHMHVLQGRSGSLDDLLALPHVGSVTGADNPALAGRVVHRLVAALQAGPPGTEGHVGARTTPRLAPRTVVVVDGWEGLDESLGEVEHGAAVDALLRLARDGMAQGVRLVVTGGRAISSGRLSGLLTRRLILSMPDPLDLTLAGVDARAAHNRLGPGRAHALPEGHLVQLAHPGACLGTGDCSIGKAQFAAVQKVAALARLQFPDVLVTRMPWTVRPLPAVVTPGDLGSPGPGELALGLGGDAASPMTIELDIDGRRWLVAGPPRSGRSTALALVARQLACSGRPVAVMTTRRSPLTGLNGIPGLRQLGAGDVDAFVALRRQHLDLGIIVDDAEGLSGTPMEAALLEAATLVDSAGGVIVAAADLQRAIGLFRGLVPEVARDGCGVLLSPGSAGDGDLLRARVDVPRERRPGLGVLVRQGTATPIQIADAFAAEAVTCHPFPTSSADTTADNPGESRAG